ncbi:MAG: phage holin family protein [Candidatus Faecivivens sp.]|nr:phage holin family protein [Oscillospiraceae bacterium]MDY2712314.1 phage holin family protein [Candidatus Faecivivens sp.]
MNECKTVFCTAVGLIGGAVAAAFGGWNAAMMTLIALMAVDYLTGLMVAGIFHKSPKSESGALESKAGWKGLCRKGVTLLVVLVAAQLDRAIGTGFIRDAAVIGYIANETLSIIENAGLMGVPVPNAVKKGIELLKKKEDEDA